MLKHQTPKSERQWKATTGLSETSFLYLSEQFGKTYEANMGISLHEKANNMKVSLLLPTYADCLFMVLFQLKNALTYDALGFLIGTGASNAQRNFESCLTVLEQTLSVLGMVPKRGFKDVAEFEKYMKDHQTLIIDGTEQATQRPKNKQQQQEMYSGKKRNTHTKS